MSITDKRYRHLEQNIGFDYILESYETMDFSEFVTSTGGDVCRYRVYGTPEEGFTIYCK